MGNLIFNSNSSNLRFEILCFNRWKCLSCLSLLQKSRKRLSVVKRVCFESTAAFWSGLPQQGECPKNYGTGICVIPETGGCLTDADCDRELQKCCSSGCNKVCTQGMWGAFNHVSVYFVALAITICRYPFGAGGGAGVVIPIAWGSELLAISILWNPKRKGIFLICSNYYQDIGY